MPKKRLLGWLVFAAIAAAVAAWVPLPQRDTASPEPDAKAAKTQAPRAQGRFESLPDRDAIGRQSGSAFSSRSWAPPHKPAPVPAPVVAAPVAPPMPYRVAGRVQHDGVMQVILTRGDVVLNVREGDTLDGTYKVEKIAPDRVTLVYTPLGTREDLPIQSALAFDSIPSARSAVAAAAPAAPAASGATAAGPAQLRWEGPQRVSAGSTFDVSLKLTSAEAVRAAPMQLQYDSKVLEPIAVRAGGFFSDGLFSYRVNPNGSIFIGASGKGATAIDAEFLVVRFKPLGGVSGTAELKISSLSLQDPSGRAIATQQPATFRTVITQ